MKTKAKFLLSKSEALNRYKQVEKLADKVSYSFKTNREVGLILRDNTKCNFSIHSPKALEYLNTPERIWYFAQGIDYEELNAIFNKKVKSFVVDNTSDLKLLTEYIDKYKIEINLLLRMRLKEKTIHTGKHFVFGFYSSQINKLIPELRKNNNIKYLGIHFHRKTQNIGEWSLKFELENMLEKETLKFIDYVNIGGGIPGKYKNFSSDVTKGIFEKIKEFKTWLNNQEIKMIIEPGRFIACSSVKLETEIMNIQDNTIIVGCSVFNGAMDTFVANIRLEIDKELSSEEGKPYTIKGKTPDSVDIFRYKAYLNNPKVGDKVTFLNAGAYNYSTDFCLLEPIETIIVE
ncbi:MAG: decarboxylase [Nanobdellota archaeon]